MHDTLAFLQNQWFRRPNVVEQVYKRNPEHYFSLTATYLFMGCVTGRRLTHAFGDARDDILWANASPKIYGNSSKRASFDVDHMYQKYVEAERPKIIILFGNVAQKGWNMLERLNKVSPNDYDLIQAPHPANRSADVVEQLEEVAAAWHQLRA